LLGYPLTLFGNLLALLGYLLSLLGYLLALLGYLLTLLVDLLTVVAYSLGHLVQPFVSVRLACPHELKVGSDFILKSL
jgi:hypothetical protein